MCITRLDVHQFFHETWDFMFTKSNILYVPFKNPHGQAAMVGEVAPSPSCHMAADFCSNQTYLGFRLPELSTTWNKFSSLWLFKSILRTRLFTMAFSLSPIQLHCLIWPFLFLRICGFECWFWTLRTFSEQKLGAPCYQMTSMNWQHHKL